MDNRKEILQNELNKYPVISDYFGYEFLRKAIRTYKTKSNSLVWSSSNFIISNYLMSHYNFREKVNFITELEKLLIFYTDNFSDYIRSEDVRKRLMSRNNSYFQGKWSELILGYFLNSRGIKILEMSKKINCSEGEIESNDIISSVGSFEVSVILSDKGREYPDDTVFFGSLEISQTAIDLINQKIKKKALQNNSTILAFDCQHIMNIYNSFSHIYLGIPVNFNVFKDAKKPILLFIRDAYTEQVCAGKLVGF